LQPGSTADLDAAYVNVTGDNMSGLLTLDGSTYAPALPSLKVYKNGANAPMQSILLSANYVGTNDINAIDWDVNHSGIVTCRIGQQLDASNRPDLVFYTSIAYNTPGRETMRLYGADGSLAVDGNIFPGSATVPGFYLGAYDATHPIIAFEGGHYFMYDQTGHALSLSMGSNYYVWGETNAHIGVPTASSSPTTGALTVAGGVGIGGAINAGGNVSAGNAPAWASSAWPFSVKLAADTVLGLSNSVAGAANLSVINAVGSSYQTLNLPSTIASTSPTTGALTVAGGVGISGAVFASSFVSTVVSAPLTGTYYFGNGTAKYLTYDGVNFNFFGGPLNVAPAAQPTSSGGAAFRIGFTGGGTQYGMTLRPQIDGTPNLLFVNSSDVAVGQISTTASATSYVTTSSRELKEDLKSFDAGNIVDNTNVYDFAWKSTGERAYGVVAQEANEVYPTAVVNSKIKKTITAEGKADEEVVEDFWGVDYSKYVPVLLQELKALRERVRDLEGKVGVGAQPA
jgi:hypothetical protein